MISTAWLAILLASILLALRSVRTVQCSHCPKHDNFKPAVSHGVLDTFSITSHVVRKHWSLLTAAEQVQYSKYAPPARTDAEGAAVMAAFLLGATTPAARQATVQAGWTRIHCHGGAETQLLCRSSPC
jgi:hypothetical protein